MKETFIIKYYFCEFNYWRTSLLYEITAENKFRKFRKRLKILSAELTTK